MGMTTTAPASDLTAEITAMFDGLARPSTGPEPVDSMTVYFSAMAKNRKGGWQVSARRGSLVQHVELRAATDQQSADAAAAEIFAVRS